MAKNVVCKKCNNLVNGWCEKVIDSPDPDMVRDCRHFVEKTNADKIRAMTDEELAYWIMCPYDSPYCTGTDQCIECTLEWLKQPAEVDDAENR